MYKSYRLLRPLVIFAGTIGILQSLAWIALSVIGIIAYFCLLNFRGMMASLGTITELVLFHLYFHGPCAQSGLPNIDYTSLNKLNLVRPPQIHVCMWIYFVLSCFWLVSSIILLTNVRYVNLRRANTFLYTWILFTIAISILDLGLGIAFGLDYDTLRHQAHNIPIEEINSTDQPEYLIMSAKAAAGIMMCVSLRGFTIWLINIILCIFFFTQTFKISDYNRIKKAISNPAFVSTNTTLQRNQSSHAPKDDRWVETLHSFSSQTLPLERSSSHETNRTNQAAALFEERKRHYEAQQLNYLRYIDKRNGHKNRINSTAIGNDLNYPPNGNVVTTQFNKQQTRQVLVPLPDYSPNVHRSDSFETRPPLRSALRASRY